MIDRFNIRVYGILIRDDRVLLSEERYQGRHLIKFPGGGLEYGEGIREALIRECREELGSLVHVGELFYVTDHFIQSAFVESDQIISFYYRITTDADIVISNAEHQLRWVKLHLSNSDSLTFPQDKAVFKMLCEKNSAVSSWSPLNIDQ